MGDFITGDGKRIIGYYIHWVTCDDADEIECLRGEEDDLMNVGMQEQQNKLMNILFNPKNEGLAKNVINELCGSVTEN